ncbi:hypothetical protein [Paenibacillus turpanensis]|uniref:hypothetical protein n=1 Tax=Paenibacillus turpanensis TaxID=2689078 RepID=UPI001409D719|nr:hypothetical protein [Paenibacillus turpanensis]
MRCPKCNGTILLNEMEVQGHDCDHCGFYLYIQHVLRIATYSAIDIDVNEDKYFKNVHQRIYEPFLIVNSDTPAIEGAQYMRNFLLQQFKINISGYPKEDLLFMALALREFATWKVFDQDVWSSTHQRNIAHVFTNLIALYKDDVFGIEGIVHQEDFISLFVLAEEIDKLTNNITQTEQFQWEPGLDEIVKVRLANEKLEWFHQYFEYRDITKPEEIEFAEPEINEYLYKREMTVEQIKNKVQQEVAELFGFNIKDLNDFIEGIVEISKRNKQLFEISPKVDGHVMTVYFVFKGQINELGLSVNKVEAIVGKMKYHPSFDEYKTLDKLSDPHMDYKFIFEYENILAFGQLDSGNSITIFENLVTTDHFIRDIFGDNATRPFKKAQENIANLMGLKIAAHYLSKNGYKVPMLEGKIPYTNIKFIKGNGVRLHLRNKQNQDIGDIDAVVIDEINREIILFEIKYYKPANDLGDAINKDRKIFEDIDKIKVRAAWVEENIRDVIKAWELKGNEYRVVTYLVTARPNYYGKEIEAMVPNFKYFTYDGVLRL